ncbi:MAG: outer membrane protein assembly factor BamD [Proteobacteria bacterium]|nr:outer membrane protein assembly factor BamD [Pseudomonadota bacterium]MDA1057635.1 outer membrane protein assembly factor BamD [Pseudomonadota bacterium]
MTGRLRIAAVVVVLAAAVAGCNSARNEAAYVERPVEELYNQAMDNLVGGDYATAAQNFDEVERQHPYSIWATRAQLMTAFSHYQANKFDDAVIAAQRYIQLHPGSDDVAYAYYLIAVSYYEQIVDVGRDQKLTELALNGLDDVMRRFPESEYARDARLKIDLTRDHLAGKEMEIGRYYQRRREELAALNRFKQVIVDYQTTTHVPEALHRLTEVYLALGLQSEAQSAAAVLGFNYPGSEWYGDAYRLLRGENLEPVEDEGSFISRTFRRVF